jgi:TolB protein
VLNADRSGAATVARGNFENPVWSPDAAAIAFDDYDSVSVMNADGSNRRTIAEGTHPAFSPDGRKVAFLTSDLALAIRDLRGGLETLLAASVSGFSWSPDGSKIAYVTAGRSGFRLEIADVRSNRTVQVAHGDTAMRPPRWSPDGSRLAFVVDRGYLVVIRSDGSRPRRLAGPGVAQSSDDATAEWSPTGDRLAYSRGTEIDVVRLDGGKPHRIAGSRVGEELSAPVWSPDGRWVVYRRSRYPLAGGHDLFVAPAGGGGRSI